MRHKVPILSISNHLLIIVHKEFSMVEEDNSVLLNLVSRDGEKFEVTFEIAKISQLIANTLDEDEDEDELDERDIAIPNVNASILRKVLEYCTHYRTVEEMTAIESPLKSAKLEELVQPWYAKYCEVEQNILFELLAAANYMDIKPLLDLTCLAVSVLIKGKSAAEIREIFNVRDEICSNEKSQIEEENEWCDKTSP